MGPGALRFALAVIVLARHMTRWCTIGHTAVYAFFVLSGFWMSCMYEQKYSRLPLATYATSRAWRLYPLIIATTAFTVVLWHACGIPVSLDPFVLVRNALVVGMADHRDAIIGPTWSLDYELQFYCALPLLVLLRRKVGVAGLWAMIALSLAAALARNYLGVRTYLLEYLGFFVAGMLLHRPSGLPVFSRNVVVGSFAVFVLLFVLPFASHGTVLFAALYSNQRDLTMLGLHIWETYNVLLAVMLIPLIDHNIRGRSIGGDRTLGDTSFALYLVHWGLVVVYLDNNTGWPAWIKVIIAASAFFGSIALGFAMQRFIDRPLEALRHRWLHAREAKALRRTSFTASAS